MRKFSDITEATGKIVFAFGRFNPPTTGHEKLITKVAKISGSDPYRIYPSLTQNPKKDPLPHALKVAYMRKMFSKHARNIIADKKAITAIDIAVKLYDEGFKDLVMVAGSDRLKEFDSLLNRYNGVTGKRHGYYKFNTISVVSAGERDPDAEGVTGMSASKMRAAAVEGDEKSFAMGVPKGFRDVSKLFQDVRKYMGIREDRDMGSMTDFENVRDAYLTGKVWNVGDLIEANGITGIIIRKGTNYVSYNDGDGKVHKAWLHDITLDERNYAKEYANYQGTPEQIARRSSRNKARRVMGDKAVKGMDVGHKDNNPLNNDPKNLKMEDPSKNRREPRLREKSDLDEIPMALLKVKNAISQMTHPKGYEDMVKQYVKKMDEPNSASKGNIINDIVKQYRNVNPRSFQQYVNKLVKKGVLPNKLAANFDIVAEVKQDKDIKDREGTQPAKYYAKDTEGDAMAPSTKKKRAAHFAKKKKGPAPGDASATTRPSKHTNKFKQMYGEKLGKNADMSDYIDDFKKSDSPQFKGKSKEKRKEMAIAAYLSRNEEMEKLDEKIAGLVTKAKKSGMPYGILKKVYDRGMAAYKTGHRPGTTAQQWAFARVNSFVTKSAGTWGKADKDLADKVRGEEFVNENIQTDIQSAMGSIPHTIEKIENYHVVKVSKENFDKTLEVLNLKNTGMQSGNIRVDADPDETSRNKKESVKEWFESNVTRAKYQMQHGDDWWWKMNEVHDKLVEKLDEDCCEDCITEEEKPCPPATKDIKLNTKNRDATIKNHNYGPLNVDEPGDYWKDIAKYWKTTEEAAKKSLCGNCVAFDVSPRMKDCMPGETSDDDGVLGYCYMHHFKCHSARSCHTWAKGGPIKSDEKSYDWQSRNEDLKEKGPGLWANIHKKRKEGRPMRKKGEKGAPTSAQLKRAQGENKLHNFKEFQLRNAWGEITEKSEYQGRPVELNNPTKGDTKKYKVYVKNDKGNVVKVEYGDPNMSIKRDDPARRKAFRARHGCDDNPGPKWKAKYWSCKFWSTKSVTDLMKG